jgi:hypothetical protein
MDLEYWRLTCPIRAKPTPTHHSFLGRPKMGDSMRRYLVLRENAGITLFIVTILMLDALAVVLLLAK